MIQKLKPNAHFIACPVEDGDELFRNGIFVFNITKMLEYIRHHPREVEIIDADVSELDHGFSSLNESHVQSVDIRRPVVLAEISPGRYNLIDGHHRVAKAVRGGTKKIRAYRLTVRQHVTFLTSKDAYLKYVAYWNEKVNEYRQR